MWKHTQNPFPVRGRKLGINTDEADESAENREQLKIAESWEIPI